jgi:hypothetical protein
MKGIILRRKPSIAGVVASTALFLVVAGGGAYAADSYIITSTHQIKPSVLKKLARDVRGPRGTRGPAGPQGIQGLTGAAGQPGSQGSAGQQGPIGPQGATGASGAAGDQGWKGAQGDQGIQGPQGNQGPQGDQGDAGAQGATGSQGATGPEGPAELESTRFCAPDLCIDADPNSGGSGGWGWDNVANAAVTDLTVGQSYPLTVTVIQDNAEQSDGSITLTWNPSDFTGPTAGSDGSATCATASTGNALTCSYTDLSHQYKSDAFNFTPLSDNPDAQVVATVNVNGETASEVFPVAITG